MLQTVGRPVQQVAFQLPTHRSSAARSQSSLCVLPYVLWLLCLVKRGAPRSASALGLTVIGNEYCARQQTNGRPAVGCSNTAAATGGNPTAARISAQLVLSWSRRGAAGG